MVPSMIGGGVPRSGDENVVLTPPVLADDGIEASPANGLLWHSMGSGKSLTIALMLDFVRSLDPTKSEVKNSRNYSGGADLILQLGSQLMVVDAKSYSAPQQDAVVSIFAPRRSLDHAPSSGALPASQVLNPASESTGQFAARCAPPGAVGGLDLILVDEAHTSVSVDPHPHPALDASVLSRGIDLVRSAMALIDERATRFAFAVPQGSVYAALGYIPRAHTCGHYGLAVPLIPRAPGVAAPGLHTRPGRNGSVGASAGGAVAA